MKTALIFVLSSHNPPYAAMIDTAMQTWDAQLLAGTRTVYYCGNPVGGDTDRVVSFDSGVEDYKTISRKNMLAYEWALRLPWDYMARVNSSCYVHKRRLLDHVQSLPQNGVMRGLISGATHTCGVKRPFMWGGGQFIMSRDVVEAMVENKELCRHDVMEDVAMSELAQECGFAINGNGLFASINKQDEKTWMALSYNSAVDSFEFTDFADIKRLSDQFFFRVKHDPDRRVDADVMRQLALHLPP